MHAFHSLCFSVILIAAPDFAAGRAANGLRDQLWTALASEDAAVAFQAARTLVHARSLAVGFLQARLRLEKTATGEQIGRWLAELESDRFAVRDRASIELTRVGAQAEPILRRKLSERPSLEVCWRIDQLLTRIALCRLSTDELRGVRAVEVLEQIGSPEALALLTTLAEGPPDARLTVEARASRDRLGQRGP